MWVRVAQRAQPCHVCISDCLPSVSSVLRVWWPAVPPGCMGRAFAELSSTQAHAEPIVLNLSAPRCAGVRARTRCHLVLTFRCSLALATMLAGRWHECAVPSEHVVVCIVVVHTMFGISGSRQAGLCLSWHVLVQGDTQFALALSYGSVVSLFSMMRPAYTLLSFGWPLAGYYLGLLWESRMVR